MGNEMKDLVEARKAVRLVLARIPQKAKDDATRVAAENLDVAMSALNERIGMLIGDDGLPLKPA